MVSDRVDALATQQSIKKYVDDQVTATDLDITTDNGSLILILIVRHLTFVVIRIRFISAIWSYSQCWS